MPASSELKPLITHLYTADPSAHIFNNKLYIYPSHDRETDIPFNDNGDQYDMADYHVFSLTSLSSPSSSPSASPAVTDHGVVLSASSIPWVSKQLWAPDCAFSATTGKYYLYFPARDKEGIFRIGVAVGDAPEGPFEPQPGPIKGSYSIDPASFVDDDDGQAYLYFGGIWGGQLQCWQNPTNGFEEEMYGTMEAQAGPALLPRVAKLRGDMLEFDEDGVSEVQILDEQRDLLEAGDHERRFFEAAWMHKYKGVYYFSYSTGDTHYLCYATGTSPLGPFTYRGRILEPVQGWTTHHSIVEFEERWWLFHHDIGLSGVDHLRCVKVREIFYDGEGNIVAERPSELDVGIVLSGV